MRGSESDRVTRFPYIATLDPERLAPIVRQVLDDEGAAVESWDVEPLTGGFSQAAAFRVFGQAAVGSLRLPWSVFLKQIKAPEEYAPGKDGDGWRREALLYEEHVLDDLPAGLHAPICYLVEQTSKTEYWLWCEFVGGVHGRDWPRSRYGEAARHVGQLRVTAAGLVLSQRS